MKAEHNIVIAIMIVFFSGLVITIFIIKNIEGKSPDWKTNTVIRTDLIGHQVEHWYFSPKDTGDIELLDYYFSHSTRNCVAAFVSINYHNKQNKLHLRGILKLEYWLIKDKWHLFNVDVTEAKWSFDDDYS